MDDYTAPQWERSALLTIDAQRDFTQREAVLTIPGTAEAVPPMSTFIAGVDGQKQVWKRLLPVCPFLYPFDSLQFQPRMKFVELTGSWNFFSPSFRVYAGINKLSFSDSS